MGKPVGFLRAKWQRAHDRLLTIPAYVLAARIARDLRADDASHMAAGVAFYAILSLFPLTVGLIALLSLVLEAGTVRNELLEFFQTYIPGSTVALETNIEAVGSIRGFLGIISLLGLFWASTSVFGAVSRAVNRAWDLREPPFYVAKLRHLTMSFSVGLLFLMSLGTTTAVQVLGRVDLPAVGRLGFLEHDGISILTRPLPFLFTLAIFSLIYKLIPNTTTRWRYIWPGALLGALAFEVGKSAFIFYLEHFSNFARVYGSLASMIVVLVWAYLSAFILIVGAELCSEYGRMREELSRGHLIQSRGAETADVDEQEAEEELW